MNLQADEIQEVLQPVLTQAGYEFVGVEIISGHGSPVMRLFVDVPGGGIDAQQLGDVNHHVLDSLRLAGLNTEYLQLEISSPGLERRLFTLAQCEPYIGKKIAVKLRDPIEGRARYKGILTAIEDEALLLALDDTDESMRCAWREIVKANVVAQLDKFSKDKKKR